MKIHYFDTYLFSNHCVIFIHTKIISWEFGGASFGEDIPAIPNLKTHYALMDAHQENWVRSLPVPILVYNSFLKLKHSGYTMKQVMELDSVRLSQLLCGCFAVT